MKKRKISVSLLYFALLIGHFGKSIHVLYIIWGYSNHFIILGSIFLRITIIAAVRGMITSVLSFEERGFDRNTGET